MLIYIKIVLVNYGVDVGEKKVSSNLTMSKNAKKHATQKISKIWFD